MEKSKKNVRDRVFTYALTWLLSYIGSLLALKSFTFTKEVGILLSIVPVLTFALFLYKYYRSVYFLDEVQIKIQMEAVVLAFSFGLLLLMTLGLLDLSVSLNKEDWSYRHLVPYFAVFYFIGYFISSRKYNFDYEKHN